jgi:hypothetical protein
VKPTEQFAQPASTSKTGLRATLRAFLRANGSGAPKNSQSSRLRGAFVLAGVRGSALDSLWFFNRPGCARIGTHEFSAVRVRASRPDAGSITPRVGLVQGGLAVMSRTLGFAGGVRAGLFEEGICS